MPLHPFCPARGVNCISRLICLPQQFCKEKYHSGRHWYHPLQTPLGIAFTTLNRVFRDHSASVGQQEAGTAHGVSADSTATGEISRRACPMYFEYFQLSSSKRAHRTLPILDKRALHRAQYEMLLPIVCLRAMVTPGA